MHKYQWRISSTRWRRMTYSKYNGSSAAVATGFKRPSRIVMAAKRVAVVIGGCLGYFANLSWLWPNRKCNMVCNGHLAQ